MEFNSRTRKGKRKNVIIRKRRQRSFDTSKKVGKDNHERSSTAVFRHVAPGTMPLQPQDSPLGAFLKALREAEIDCILIGTMAAIEQGAPLMTGIMTWVAARATIRSASFHRATPGRRSVRELYELSDGNRSCHLFGWIDPSRQSGNTPLGPP
jgi:hypothetical protein